MSLQVRSSPASDLRLETVGMGETIDLGDCLEAFVAAPISEGRYPSRQDVLQPSVRLLEERERKLVAFAAEIDLGLSDIDAGRVKPVSDVFDRLEAKYRSMASATER